MIPFSKKYPNQAQRLINEAVVDLKEDGIVVSAGAVTEWRNSGTGGSAYDCDVVVGTGANLKVHPSGSARMYATTSDFISTTDSAAIPVGEVTCCYLGYYQPDDLTPAASDSIFQQYPGAPNNSWAVLISTGGNLVFIYSTDGTASATKTSTATLGSAGLSDGDGFWWMVKVDQSGATDTYDFYLDTVSSPFAAAENLNFAALGDQVTGTGGSVFNSSALVAIGSGAPSSCAFRAYIVNGTDHTATPAISFDARDYVSGSTLWGAQIVTPAQRNYSTWTSSGTGSIANNGDSTWTITDSDDDVGQYTLFREVTVPSGSRVRYRLTVRQGTAEKIGLRIIYLGGTASNLQLDYDFSTDAWDEQANANSGTYEAVHNADGTTTFTLAMTDGGANTSVRVYVYGAGIAAGYQGTQDLIGLPDIQAEWTLNGNTFIQNTGRDVVHTIGSAGLETTAGQTIAVPFTLFSVARASQLAAADRALWGSKSDTAKEPHAFLDFSSGGNWTVNAGNGVDTGLADDTDWHVITLQHNGDGTSKFTVSGVGSDTDDFGAEPLDFGTVLNFSAASNAGWIGPAARYIVFDRALTDAEIYRLQNYLEGYING